MTARCAATCLFLFTMLAGGALADDFDFSISKNIAGKNRHPRIAITPDGHALVVWRSGPYMNYVDAAHHTAFCKAKSGGTYKVKKARTLADSDKLINSYNLAFNAEDGSWVVVWSEEYTSTYSCDSNKIYSQKFTKTGRSTGARNVIVEDEHADDHEPVIAYLPSSGGSPPVAKGGYLLVWDSYRPLDLKNSGLYSVHLDDKGCPLPVRLNT